MDKEDVVCIHNGTLLSQKENKILPFATIWMNPESIMLNERSQKNTYHMISRICGILNNKTSVQTDS